MGVMLTAVYLYSAGRRPTALPFAIQQQLYAAGEGQLGCQGLLI